MLLYDQNRSKVQKLELDQDLNGGKVRKRWDLPLDGRSGK